MSKLELAGDMLDVLDCMAYGTGDLCYLHSWPDNENEQGYRMGVLHSGKLYSVGIDEIIDQLEKKEISIQEGAEAVYRKYSKQIIEENRKKMEV